MAQYNLGIFYFQGQGVKKDVIEAYKWIFLASEAGYHHAVNDLAILTSKLSRRQIAKSKKLTLNWRPTTQS